MQRWSRLFAPTVRQTIYDSGHHWRSEGASCLIAIASLLARCSLAETLANYEGNAMTKIRGVRHVGFGSRDPKKSAAFYVDALGMECISFLEDSQTAFLSFGDRDHDIVLIKVPEDQPVGTGRIGHTAIEIDGGLEELRELYRHLKEVGVNVDRTTDHVITSSLYIQDPDGNRLELYAAMMPPAEAKQYRRESTETGQVQRPLELDTVVD